MTTSNQVIEKGDGVLLRKFKDADNHYYAVIKCKYCGTEKTVNWYSFLKEKPRSCANCSSDLITKTVGKTFGHIYVKAFDHKEDKYLTSGKRQVRLYFKVKCLICGAEGIALRNVGNWKHSEHCRHCAFESSSSHISNDGALNNLYRTYRKNAKDRNITGNLSSDKFKELIQQPCYYCGQEPQLRGSGYRAIIANGIDRLDSNGNYEENNCVSCCKMCNVMKLDYTNEDFLSHVKRIYEHSIKGSTTIPNGSTSQANGDGNGEHLETDDDIV